MLDQLYIQVYHYYKKRYGRRSIRIAGVYINILHAALLWVCSTFALAFASQMKLPVLSTPKFFGLFTLLTLGLIFKNWLYYNGRTRTVLASRFKGRSYSILFLWLLPAGCIGLGYILFQLL